MPVISATQEAEAGGPLEPGRQRSSWVEITPVYSSLSGTGRLCLKQKSHRLGGSRVSIGIEWIRPGMVAHTGNPSTLGGRGGWTMRSRDRDRPGQHGETPSLLKRQKISWAWWCVPVIPATQEAEAGELLEPRRRRLQWAKIAPLHSSLGNKSETRSQKKEKRIRDGDVQSRVT